MSTNKPSKTSGSTKRESPEQHAAEEFGQRLRAARAARGMTLRDVANEAEVSIAYLSDLERAVLTNPTLGTLRRIAQALEISIDDLLTGGDAAAPRTASLPPALAAFADEPVFKAEIEAQANRSRRDADELQAEWLRMLEAVQVGGQRPTSPSDYLFIFESIRRVLNFG